jgi:hypothetical protein
MSSNCFQLFTTVYEPYMVHCGGHATLFRLSSLHLSALAMEEMGTCMAGRCCTRLSRVHLLPLRQR